MIKTVLLHLQVLVEHVALNESDSIVPYNIRIQLQTLSIVISTVARPNVTRDSIPTLVHILWHLHLIYSVRICHI